VEGQWGQVQAGAEDRRGSLFTLRTLREGALPILVLLLLCLAGFLWIRWVGLVLVLPLLFGVLFFRDPGRPNPGIEGAILAPADGKVVDISRVPEERFLRGEAIRVAIFLSVFDVHVQRMPIAGGIKVVHSQSGRHLDARDGRAGALNESRFLGIEAEDGFRVVVRQIAGKIARRIVGWAGEGSVLRQGQRLGMIRFGSRVELFLPPETEVLVALNEHVKGGDSILARRK
jgi:phosphatidylserine decarboxylase